MTDTLSPPGGYTPEWAPPAGHRDPTEVEDELLEYVDDCYADEQPLNPNKIKELFQSACGPLPWTRRADYDVPLLHLVVMCSMTNHIDMQIIVAELGAAGADPMLEDGDGDTALMSTIAMTEGGEGAKTMQQKLTFMSAVEAVLRLPATKVDSDTSRQICNWLRTMSPKKKVPQADAEVAKECFAMLEQTLSALGAKTSRKEVRQFWSSLELLQYLETCDDKQSQAKVKHVTKYLERGARASYTQNGATALLVAVLNPFSSSRSELEQVIKLLIESDPECVKIRDAFKLTAMQWAADYINVAQQHGLKTPNALAFLVLVPAILKSLPADSKVGPEAGVACLKVRPFGTSGALPSRVEVSAPRFLEGDRVVCLVESPGGKYDWEEGMVVNLWYWEPFWPTDHPGCPYEVMLDLGLKVFAPADDDRVIYKEVKAPHSKAQTSSNTPAESTSQPAPAADPVASAAAVPTTTQDAGAKPKAATASRFVRRQRDDGKWELLDTISGRARPAPSDSESD